MSTQPKSFFDWPPEEKRKIVFSEREELDFIIPLEENRKEEEYIK